MEKDNWDPEFIKKTKIENEKRKKHLAAKKKKNNINSTASDVFVMHNNSY